MNLNWGAWCQGLISAISDAVLIALGIVVFVPGKTSFREVALVCAIPVAKGFLTYLKQTPPPIGKCDGPK